MARLFLLDLKIRVGVPPHLPPISFHSLHFLSADRAFSIGCAGLPGQKKIHPHRRSIGRGRWVGVIENHPEFGLSRSIDLLSHPNPCDRLADRRLRLRSLPPLTEPVVQSRSCFVPYFSIFRKTITQNVSPTRDPSGPATRDAPGGRRRSRERAQPRRQPAAQRSLRQ